MYKNCQSCGNPIISDTDFGTESDGQRSPDFCSNCYKGGNLYRQDWRGEMDEPIPSPYPGMYVGRMGYGLMNDGPTWF